MDVPGDELYLANIPVGPSNVINRTIGFTVADGTDAGPFFYISSAVVSAGIPMTATVIADNSTTSAYFNFTDEFLEASTDMTDRLRCVLPPAAVDVYYSPSIDRVVLSGVDGYGSGHLHLARKRMRSLITAIPVLSKWPTAMANGASAPGIPGHAVFVEGAVRVYDLSYGYGSLNLVGAAALGRGWALRGRARFCVTNEFLSSCIAAGRSVCAERGAAQIIVEGDLHHLADHQLGLSAGDLVLRG